MNPPPTDRSPGTRERRAQEQHREPERPAHHPDRPDRTLPSPRRRGSPRPCPAPRFQPGARSQRERPVRQSAQRDARRVDLGAARRGVARQLFAALAYPLVSVSPRVSSRDPPPPLPPHRPQGLAAEIARLKDAAAKLGTGNKDETPRGDRVRAQASRALEAIWHEGATARSPRHGSNGLDSPTAQNTSDVESFQSPHAERALLEEEARAARTVRQLGKGREGGWGGAEVLSALAEAPTARKPRENGTKTVRRRYSCFLAFRSRPCDQPRSHLFSGGCDQPRSRFSAHACDQPRNRLAARALRLCDRS